VVIATKACIIEPVDDVGALEILLPKMGSTVSDFLIMTYYVKGSMRLVTRKALLQGISARPRLVQGRWRWVTGSSRPAFVEGSEGIRTVVVVEMGTSGAGRVGRRRVTIPPALR